ncbi:MAG: flavodoxin domain-containing protein [Granulosicoccaceae bacterium]
MHKITLIFGSVYGSAHYVATEMEKALRQLGHEVDLIEEPSAQQIAAADILLIVTSTTGEGELPIRLHPLLQALQSKRVTLEGLSYALVALGDSSYTHYCGGGRSLASALDACGAAALAPALELDTSHCLNPEDEALPWALRLIEEHT